MNCSSHLGSCFEIGPNRVAGEVERKAWIQETKEKDGMTQGLLERGRGRALG